MGVRYDIDMFSIRLPAKCLPRSISLGGELQSRDTATNMAKNFVCSTQRTSQTPNSFQSKSAVVIFIKSIFISMSIMVLT